MPTSSWCCLTSGRSPRSSVFLFHLLLHLRKSLPRGSQWHEKEMSPSLLPGKAGLQLSVGYNVTPPTLTSLFFFPFTSTILLSFTLPLLLTSTLPSQILLISPPHTHTRYSTAQRCRVPAVTAARKSGRAAGAGGGWERAWEIKIRWKGKKEHLGNCD